MRERRWVGEGWGVGRGGCNGSGVRVLEGVRVLKVERMGVSEVGMKAVCGCMMVWWGLEGAGRGGGEGG